MYIKLKKWIVLMKMMVKIVLDKRSSHTNKIINQMNMNLKGVNNLSNKIEDSKTIKIECMLMIFDSDNLQL